MSDGVRMLVAMLVAMVARCILLAALTLAVWSAMPALWGWTPTTVSSDSMSPAIRAGDVVVAAPIDPATVTPGQVLLVDDPVTPGNLRLHRLVDTNGGSFVLRGDANADNDSDRISPSAVRGVGVLRVPLVGLPGMWLRNGDTVALAGTGAGTIVLLVLSGLDRPLGAVPEVRRRARLRRTAWLATAMALAAMSLTFSPPGSGATFASMAANPRSSFGARSAYACLTPVPADSPSLFYGFGELSGTVAADTSGHRKSTRLVGGATHLAGSCVRNSSPALRLNGTNAFLSTATAVPAPGQFSLEAWFRTSTKAGGTLIGFADRRLYMTSSGRVVFGVSAGSPETVASGSTYNDGRWHLATATLSAGGMLLYVDGILVGDDRSVTAAPAGSGYWRIGYDNLAGWPMTPKSSYFSGTIDSVALYPSALTPAKVASHVTAGH